MHILNLMSKYSIDIIHSAHKHSISHQDEIMKSELCGCFYCLSNFNPATIVEWIEEENNKGKTALCPKCGIDSVIGDLSGFPIADIEFLKEMNHSWF